MFESAWDYVHSGSLRESIATFKGEKVIIALKPLLEDFLKSEGTGEEITLKKAESGDYGKDFRYLGKIQTGTYVLIPGIVEFLKHRKDDKGNPLSRIKRLIMNSEKPELEQIVRQLGYTSEIKYWETEDFF